MHSITWVKLTRVRAPGGVAYLTAFLCRDLPAFREYSTVRVSSTTTYRYQIRLMKRFNSAQAPTSRSGGLGLHSLFSIFLSRSRLISKVFVCIRFPQ